MNHTPDTVAHCSICQSIVMAPAGSSSVERFDLRETAVAADWQCCGLSMVPGPITTDTGTRCVYCGAGCEYCPCMNIAIANATLMHHEDGHHTMCHPVGCTYAANL